MAAIGIISGIANLLAGGMKEDWLSITVNVTVILLFTYYLFTNSRKQYRKIKMETIKRVAKAEKI
jgi:hypothetical protein